MTSTGFWPTFGIRRFWDRFSKNGHLSQAVGDTSGAELLRSLAVSFQETENPGLTIEMENPSFSISSSPLEGVTATWTIANPEVSHWSAELGLGLKRQTQWLRGFRVGGAGYRGEFLLRGGLGKHQFRPSGSIGTVIIPSNAECKQQL